jgi:hypothetical protein
MRLIPHLHLMLRLRMSGAIPLLLTISPYDADRYNFTIKEDGLEVSAENTKYMFIFCQQIAGQNCDIWIANKTFENAASSNAQGQY